jgi:hypothetical protein
MIGPPVIFVLVREVEFYPAVDAKVVVNVSNFNFRELFLGSFSFLDLVLLNLRDSVCKTICF